MQRERSMAAHRVARLLNALLEIPPFYPLVVLAWCFVVESVEQTVDLSQVRTTAPRSQCSDSAESESCKPWTEKKQTFVWNDKLFHFALTAHFDAYRSNP